MVNGEWISKEMVIPRFGIGIGNGGIAWRRRIGFYRPNNFLEA